MRRVAASTLLGLVASACAGGAPPRAEVVAPVADVVPDAAAPAPAPPPAPTTFDVDWGDHWKVGQVATLIEHETSDMNMTMNGEPFQSERETFDATYVVRCDELDETGAPANRTVFVQSWKRTKGDVTDNSISGSWIAVKRKTWSLPAGKTAGPLARAWLDKKFAKGDDNPLAHLAPRRMAIGEMWKPDPKTAAGIFTKAMGPAPFDVTDVDMEITLLSVDGAPPDAVGTFAIKVHVPIAGKLHGMPPEAVIAPGAGADLVGEATGALSGAGGVGSGSHMNLSLTMNIEVNQDGQKTVFASKAAGVHDKSAVAGGTIPEPATK